MSIIPRAGAGHLLVLLSVVAAISLSSGAAAAAAAAALPVYDTEGHELSADADYYVLPASRGSGSDDGGGGGLTMAPNGLRCPLFVAQEADPLRKGFPVRFTPLPQEQEQRDRTVRVASDVGVHFAAVTTCVQTTEWHVSGAGDGDAPVPLPPLPGPGRRRRLVLTGPVQSPSPNGREKVFRVEKHGRGYTLVWCGAAAGSTSTSSSSCQDLGVFKDDGDRRAWLGTTDTDRAHVVVFEKAATIHA